jgi:hypothetical protein
MGMIGELRVWRRQHSRDIVTEVAPVPGIGSWEASACRESDGTTRVEMGRYYSLLTDAHLAADTLAANTFGHRCDNTCGAWTAIERRDKPR